MSMSKFASQADYWKDRAECAEAKLAELEEQEAFDVDAAHGRFREAFEATLKYGNWPLKRKGHGYRSPMTQMAWDVAFGTVNRLKLYASPVPSEDSFVTVTTAEDGRCVMVSRQDEDHRILRVLWEAKDAPTEPARLTDLEIYSMVEEDVFLGNVKEIVRIVETAVLRKNGLLRED